MGDFSVLASHPSAGARVASRTPLLSDAAAGARAGAAYAGAPGSLVALASDDATVDAGFAGGGAPFERGRALMRLGSPTLDVSQLQTPLSSGAFARSALSIAGALALGPFGCCYLSSKLTLVRKGELALVRSISGETRALGPGWHLMDTVGCDILKESITSPLIKFGPLTIVRVLPGHAGLAQVNGEPLLLAPGVHLINDPLFSFQSCVPSSEPYFSIGATLHVITVGPDQVGLCLADARGHVLGPGRHTINHERFSFVGLRPVRSEYLNVGSKHRILLAEGRLGLAWEGGSPQILEPAPDRRAICIDSPTFSFERSVVATQLVISHGALKVITVRQGFVGVSFADGALEVLPPGRVTLSSVTHAFAGFLPTAQQTLQLASIDGMTSDNVGLEFDAAICVQIVDAKKAIMALSTTAAGARDALAAGSEQGFNSDTIWAAVSAKARLSLSIIIGNNKLNRGDARDDDDAHPPMQPGRGLGPGAPSYGAAPAEAAAAADARAARAAPPASAPGAKGGAGAGAGAGGGGGGGGGEDPAPADAGASKGSSFRSRIHDSFLQVREQRAR